MTVFAMSGMEEEASLLLMNALTSFLRFGGSGGGSYLVAATSAAALAGCRRLRLPCWNASAVVAAGMAPAACAHLGQARLCPALVRYLQRHGAQGAYLSHG